MKKSVTQKQKEPLFTGLLTEIQLPAFAQQLKEQLAAKVIWFFLEGELGVGKTRLAQELLKAFSVQEAFQGSPTFSIMNVYRTQQGESIVHADFYRLTDETELEQSGVEAALWEDRSHAILEWASLFPHTFEKNRLPPEVLPIQIQIVWSELEQTKELMQASPIKKDSSRQYEVRVISK